MTDPRVHFARPKCDLIFTIEAHEPMMIDGRDAVEFLDRHGVTVSQYAPIGCHKGDSVTFTFGGVPLEIAVLFKLQSRHSVKIKETFDEESFTVVQTLTSRTGGIFDTTEMEDYYERQHMKPCNWAPLRQYVPADTPYTIKFSGLDYDTAVLHKLRFGGELFREKGVEHQTRLERLRNFLKRATRWFKK